MQLAGGPPRVYLRDLKKLAGLFPGGIMRAQTIGVRESTGRVLSCTIFRPGGKKLLAKGHLISDEDVELLEVEGMGEIWVAQLEDGEIGEDEAVMSVASEVGCGSLEIRLAAGGR